MVASVRAAALPAVVPSLTNVTLTTPANPSGVIALLRSDNRTIVSAAANAIYVSTNYGSSQTQGKNFRGGEPGWEVEGLMELPSGEVLVSIKHATLPGEVYRSTGWNPATGQATSWAVVLTAGGPGVYFRGQWGMNDHCIAPTWSRHAGAIWLAEYGPQTDVAATPAQAAIRVYLTEDDAVTFRQVLDVRDLRPSTDIHLHLHSVCYDPWDGRLYVVHGDGGAGGTVGSSGIFYSDNPTATEPTFTLVPGTSRSDGRRQPTSIAAYEAGIITLPDGAPYAAGVFPRRGFRRLGPWKDTAYVTGRPGSIYIGGTIYRTGGQEDPSPGAPILMCNIEPSDFTAGYPAILASIDGLSVKEIYRHTVQASNGAPGINFVAGPTADGKIVASISDGTNGPQVLTADYAPALPSSDTSEPLWQEEIVSTLDPRLAMASKGVGTANRGFYMRLSGSGTVAGFAVQVNTASGNICVAVYGNTGVGPAAVPGTRKATTGSIACPAAGSRQIALPVTVEDGDWLYFGADNTTAAFRAFNTSTNILSGTANGVAYQESVFPAPTTPGTLTADQSANYLLTGY